MCRRRSSTDNPNGCQLPETAVRISRSPITISMRPSQLPLHSGAHRRCARRIRATRRGQSGFHRHTFGCRLGDEEEELAPAHGLQKATTYLVFYRGVSADLMTIVI